MTHYRKFYAYDPVTGQQIDVVPHADVRRQEQAQAKAEAAAEAQATAQERQRETDAYLAAGATRLKAENVRQGRTHGIVVHDPQNVPGRRRRRR